MAINSINQTTLNSNKPSVSKRIAGSAVTAAALTSLIGTVYMVEGAYSSPHKEKENFVQHIIRDLGTDVKKRYTKFFDRLSLSKLSNKVNNAKPSTLAGVWLGGIFSAIFATTYLILSREKENK